MNQQVQPAEYQQTAGARLKDARLALGMSAMEVADQLNVSAKVVGSLETDECTDIPSVYRQGYLQHYAKLVGIDYAELKALAVIDDQTCDTPLVRRIPVEQGNRWFEQSLKVASYAIVTAGVVIPLVWVFTQGALELSFDDSLRSPAPVATEIVDNAVNDSAADRQPALSLAVPDAVSAPATLSASAAPFTRINRSGASRIENTEQEQSQADTDNPIAPITSPEAGHVSAATASAEVTELQQLAIGEMDILELNLLDGSWVEITDANGEKLEFDLLQAGQNKQYSGVAPFEIIFGQASAVDLKLNGEKVDLSPFTRSDVATVVLQSNRKMPSDAEADQSNNEGAEPATTG